MLPVLLGLLLSLTSSIRHPLATSQPAPSAAGTSFDSWAPYQSVLEGETLEKQREIFRLGYRFFQEKKWEGARVFFTRALEVYPLLADYSLYYLGSLNRQAGQTAEARARFLRLRTEHPTSIWCGQAALEVAQLGLAARNWPEAMQYAEQARAARPSQTSVHHKATLILAQAQEGQGNRNEAYRLYQTLRRATPLSATGKAAKARVEHLRIRAPERFALRDAQAYLEEVRLLAQEGDGAGIEALAQQFATRFPTSRLRPHVLRALASVYKQQKRTTEAAAVLKEAVTRYPNSTEAPEALYEWAHLLWNNDQDDEARPLFEQLTQQYPHHKWAAEAWYAIGRIFQARQDDEQAARTYQRLATLFPNSTLARDGRWRQGWMAYRRGDFQRAESLFAGLARTAPGTPEGESALYWQARAAERRALPEKAVQAYRELLRRYPSGYYALWAEKQLNITPSSLEPGAEEVASPPPLSSQLDAYYRRSQELCALGLLNLARRELDRVRDGVPRQTAFTRFLLAEYSRLEGYTEALRLAQRLARNSTRNWRRYFFPRAYWELINAQAQKKQLDSYLILALIRQESLFDPEAVSPAQAYGLMQLLPITAARLTSWPSNKTLPLTDPTFNIELGTTYLRQLLDLYDNNLIMAVAAYNAGERAVDKWRTRHPDLAPDEFVESISYRETRNYVKLVLRNYRTYLRLYGQQDGTDGQRPGLL